MQARLSSLSSANQHRRMPTMAAWSSVIKRARHQWERIRTNDIARIYPAEILLAVSSGDLSVAKAHGLTHVNQIAEQLAEWWKRRRSFESRVTAATACRSSTSRAACARTSSRSCATSFKSRPPTRPAEISEAHEPWKAS